MAKKKFALVKIENKELVTQEKVKAFEQDVRIVLLLALLERDILTHRQFDKCVEEIKKTKVSKNNSCEQVQII